MGVVRNIAIDLFPRQQTDIVGSRVEVCFHYDTDASIGADVVRADAEEPFVMLFKLDDGRHVLASECQWRPKV